MQPVSTLILFHNMLIRDLRRRHGSDRLMTGRVKALPHGRDGLDSELAQHTFQLLEREIDALNQSLCGLAVLRRLDGPFKIIDDWQEFLQQLLVAEPDLVPLIALSKPLIIVELGGKPEVLIVQRLQFAVPRRRFSQRVTGRSGSTRVSV